VGRNFAGSLVINGVRMAVSATGPAVAHAHFEDGQTIKIEPWPRAFPSSKTVVNRLFRPHYQRAVVSGHGGTPDGNTLPVSKDSSDHAITPACRVGHA